MKFLGKPNWQKWGHVNNMAPLCEHYKVVEMQYTTLAERKVDAGESRKASQTSQGRTTYCDMQNMRDWGYHCLNYRVMGMGITATCSASQFLIISYKHRPSSRSAPSQGAKWQNWLDLAHTQKAHARASSVRPLLCCFWDDPSSFQWLSLPLTPKR